MKFFIRSIFLHPLQAGSRYPTHRKLRFTRLSEKTRSGSTKTHIPETNRTDVQAVRHKNVPYCLQKDTPKTRRIRGEIEKTGVIVKSASSFSEDPSLIHIVEVRMLPFQLLGLIAFGVQFDGFFQVFKSAFLIPFQVLGTPPFGVCFAEIR